MVELLDSCVQDFYPDIDDDDDDDNDEGEAEGKPEVKGNNKNTIGKSNVEKLQGTRRNLQSTRGNLQRIRTSLPRMRRKRRPRVTVWDPILLGKDVLSMAAPCSTYRNRGTVAYIFLPVETKGIG